MSKQKKEVGSEWDFLWNVSVIFVFLMILIQYQKKLFVFAHLH